MGGPYALNYSVLMDVLRFYKKKERKKLFKQVRWIEKGAIDAINKKKK